MDYLNKFDQWLKTLSTAQSFCFAIIMSIIVTGLFVFLNWLFSPKRHGDKYSVYAVVEEKSYAPSRRSSGTGIGVSGSGQIGTVITSSTSSQSFNVVFITEDKKVFVANDKKAYGQLSIGQRVKIWLQPYRYFGKEKEPKYITYEII